MHILVYVKILHLFCSKSKILNNFYDSYFDDVLIFSVLSYYAKYI